MGQGFLLDTNCVIDFCGNKLPPSVMIQMQQVVNNGFSISPIVQIEVLGFNGMPADMQKLEGFLRFGSVLHLTDIIIDETIRLRRNRKLKLGDAIIAATALVNNLVLLTRNTKDFTHIPGLSIQDPYQM